MRAHRGQVVLYLALVLVALTFLVLMNVGAYLAVSARNTSMNGGDAAALAVAKHQGDLLNRIGQWNLDHLNLAFDETKSPDEKRLAAAEIADAQARCCFLDPLDGLSIGNDYAKKNDCDQSADMSKILKDHVADIRANYETTPEVYPEPWEGAWEEYSQKLEIAAGQDVWAGADNINFIDASTDHLLLNPMFYQAIAGRDWCWFYFHAHDTLERYASFSNWGPLPTATEDERRRRSCNSEVYSLNLERKVGSLLDLLGPRAIEIVTFLTGKSADEVKKAELLHDQSQVWYFYDSSVWRDWWELDPHGEYNFPAMGQVKSEYDVRGCAAICRVVRHFSNVVRDGGERESVWSAAAKPFGTVQDLDGATAVVTAYNFFVTPAFTDVRLVPLDSVGGRDLSTADPEWIDHVRGHLPYYLAHGPGANPECGYCQRLTTWENPSFRASGLEWIKYNSSTCTRSSGTNGGRGGAAHGH